MVGAGGVVGDELVVGRMPPVALRLHAIAPPSGLGQVRHVTDPRLGWPTRLAEPARVHGPSCAAAAGTIGILGWPYPVPGRRPPL